MRVVATAVGFDGVTVRQIGEEFEAPKGANGQAQKATWYKAVEVKKPERKDAGNDLA